MKNKLDYEGLILHYLQDELNEDEKDILFEWVAKKEENEQIFLNIQETWARCAAEMTPLSSKYELQKAFESLWNKLPEERPRRTIIYFKQKERWRVAIAIVAILTVGFFSGKSFQSGKDKNNSTATAQQYEISVDNKNQPHIILPDGTNVWLNARSSLKYPSHFNSDTRDVWLEGEAFFDVSHNAEHPFIVHTDHFDMLVRGTSFNVSSYKDNDEFQTTLVEGEIEVKANTSIHHQQKSIALHPREMVVYKKSNNQMELRKDVDVDLYTCWKEGIFRFDELEFAEISKQLERRFGISFIYMNDEIKHKAYTGIFYNYQSLNEILSLINKSTPFKYTIEEHFVKIY